MDELLNALVVMLGRCDDDEIKVARSVHSGRLLRALAEHVSRGDETAMVFRGGWDSMAKSLGFTSADDVSATKQAVTFWDAVRLTNPGRSFSVRVLVWERFPGKDGRPVVKLTPGLALPDIVRLLDAIFEAETVTSTSNAPVRP